MFSTYEIQFDTPAGRSAFMLVAAFGADDARLVARDMLLEFVAHEADRAAIRSAMKDATVYEVSVNRIQPAA